MLGKRALSLFVFALVCAQALADDALLDKIRKAGIPLVRAREYIAAVEVFSKHDQLSGMNYHSGRFSEEGGSLGVHWTSNFSQDPAFQAARRTIIEFHRTFGDQNPVTDAANFVRARRQYEYMFGAERGAALDLSQVRSDLAKGQQAFDGLGKNGPTISGPGINRDMQEIHYRETSIEMQSRNLARKDIVGLADRLGGANFSELNQVTKALEGMSAVEEATLTVEHDAALIERLATERNSLLPEQPVTAAAVKAAVLKEIDRMKKHDFDLLKTEKWSSLLDIAIARYLHSVGIRASYGTLDLRRIDGQWRFFDLQNRKAAEAVYAAAREVKPLTIQSGFGHTYEGIANLIRENFGPTVQAALETVSSRQRFKPGRNLAGLQAQVLADAAHDMMVPIVNSFDRTNQLTYEISGAEVAYQVLKSLASWRETFFLPVGVPTVVAPGPTGRAVHAGELQVKGTGTTPLVAADSPAVDRRVPPCGGRGGFWHRLLGSVFVFGGGAR